MKFIIGAFRYLLDVISLERADVILLSFPKAGNTRVRLFYADYIRRREATDIQLSFDYVNRKLPEMGQGRLFSDQRKTGQTGFRLVKSHYMPLLLLMKVKICGIRVVYLRRSNWEVLVSSYEYSVNRGNVSIERLASFSNFFKSKYGLSRLVKLEKRTSFINEKLVIDFDVLLDREEQVLFDFADYIGLNDSKNVWLSIAATKRNEILNLVNEKDRLDYKFASKKHRQKTDFYDEKMIREFNKALSAYGYSL